MKKIVTYMLIFFSIICMPTITRAGIMDDVIKSGDDFLSSANSSVETVNETKLKEASSDIYNILLYTGIGLSVLIGAIMGIQFMVASAEDKAKIKESLIPYIVGCVVIFGAFGIWRMAMNIFNTL